jgi:hypothetical protein
MAQDREVDFPRQGWIESTVDLDYDRTLRPGFIYRIKLSIQNFLNAKDSRIHTLYVTSDPVPVVSPGMGNRVVYGESSKASILQATYEFASGCYTSSSDTPTTTFTTTTTLLGHKSYENRGLARISWSEIALSSGAVLANATDYYSSVSPTTLTFPAQSLSQGQHVFEIQVCMFTAITVARNLSAESQGQSQLYLVTSSTTTTTTTLCGAFTFILYMDFQVPQNAYEATRGGRRLGNLPLGDLISQLRLEVASFSYGEDLYGAPIVKQPIAPLLGVMHNAAESTSFLADGYRQWGVPLNANDSVVFGAVIVPPSTATPWDLSILAWYQPRVLWRVTGATASSPLEGVTPTMGVEAVAGNFLRIPKEQMSAGATVSVSVEIVLEEPGEESCQSGARRIKAPCNAVGDPLRYKYVGARVSRGPDWNSGDQDGGAGSVGLTVSGAQQDGYVRVRWPSGSYFNYRVGADNSYDLQCTEVAFTTTVNAPPVAGFLETLSLGALSLLKSTSCTSTTGWMNMLPWCIVSASLMHLARSAH